ncbi:MAG: NAD(P)H-dependent oxidoreductase [Bauldia sp.]
MLKVAIVVGSTRPGRKADAVAKWVLDIARKRGDATYEILDIADYNLPLLDEPTPPSMRRYTKDHTKRWSAAVEGFDAFVFVTPEYNRAPSAALKNAIDFLYQEWNNKAAGFVGYGSAGGSRAIEHLRTIMGELQIADVRQPVLLSLFTDFENYTVFKPAAAHEATVGTMLGQVVAWGEAMKSVRAKQKAAA